MRRVKRYSARQLLQIEGARRALVEGFDAFLADQPIDANSHNPQKVPAVYAAWRTGWLEAWAVLGSADPISTRRAPMSRPSVKAPRFRSM
jgi:hypothetical protein